MKTMKGASCFKRRLPLGFVIKILTIVACSLALLFMAPSVTHANKNADTQACVASSTVFCIAPEQPQNNPDNNSACGIGQQYYTGNDGVANIAWTNTYGNLHCLTVVWGLSTYAHGAVGPITTGLCDASMYVPIHHATAKLIYGLVINGQRTGNIFGGAIDQSQYSDGAFVFIGHLNLHVGDNVGVVLEDDIGGMYGAQLGWGTDASHSLKLTC
jgi:hypothetical protein